MSTKIIFSIFPLQKIPQPESDGTCNANPIGPGRAPICAESVFGQPIRACSGCAFHFRFGLPERSPEKISASLQCQCFRIIRISNFQF